MRWHKGCKARYNLWMIFGNEECAFLMMFYQWCFVFPTCGHIMSYIPLLWNLFILTNWNIWFWPSILFIIQFFNKFHFACYWIFHCKKPIDNINLLSPRITKYHAFPCHWRDFTSWTGICRNFPLWICGCSMHCRWVCVDSVIHIHHPKHCGVEDAPTWRS